MYQGEKHLEFEFGNGLTPIEWESYIKYIQDSLLPEQTHGEDRPHEKSDFSHILERLTQGLEFVYEFIKSFTHKDSASNFDRNALAWTLILCGEHSSKALWVTEDSLNLSSSCLKALCSFFDCFSLSQLLLGQSAEMKSPYFKHILSLLRPKLLKNTWRKYPGAVLSYKWSLTQVCSPHLSEYLDIISPTALLMVDDHDVERRLVGFECLSHIIDNVARTEICRRGLDQVFYKTLEPIIWQRSAQLIEPTFGCLVKLLKVTQRGYTRNVESGSWDLFDDTLSALLDKMTFEDQIPLRLAYIKSLPPLLLEMGPQVIRWSKPLLMMFDEYLSKESFDTRRVAMKALDIYIHLSAVRLLYNGDHIMFLLVRTLIDISHMVYLEGKCQDLDLVDIVRDNIVFVGSIMPDSIDLIMTKIEADSIKYKLFWKVIKECKSKIVNS